MRQYLLSGAFALFALVSAAAPVEVRVTTPETSRFYGNVSVSLNLYTTDPTESFNDYTVALEYDGRVYKENITGMSVSFNNSKNYTMDHKLPLEKYGTLDYKVWAECRGQKSEVREMTVRSYPYKVLCEEVTATWCQWCIRGIVALEDLRANYSDRTVCIAVHKDDVMAVQSYIDNLNAINAIGGIPTGYLNRKARTGPENFKSYITTLANSEPIICAMRLNADPGENGDILVKTDVWFAHDYTDTRYTIAYVVVENGINMPGNSAYNQKNAYSGGANGAMGGYENKPTTILAKDMWYNDVARGYIGSFNGFPGAIPTDVKAGEVYSHDMRVLLPAEVMNPANTELVAIVVDRADGHVINSEIVSLDFDNRDNNAVDTIAAEKRVVGRYSLTGTPVDQFTKGIQIVVYDDGSASKVFIR